MTGKKDGKYLCGRCHKRFGDKQALQNHATMGHQGKGADMFVMFGTTIEVDEPSFADRVVEAQMDAAMGMPVDDDLRDWI